MELQGKIKTSAFRHVRRQELKWTTTPPPPEEQLVDLSKMESSQAFPSRLSLIRAMQG
jgi:hypothetical protein